MSVCRGGTWWWGFVFGGKFVRFDRAMLISSLATPPETCLTFLRSVVARRTRIAQLPGWGLCLRGNRDSRRVTDGRVPSPSRAGGFSIRFCDRLRWFESPIPRDKMRPRCSVFLSGKWQHEFGSFATAISGDFGFRQYRVFGGHLANPGEIADQDNGKRNGTGDRFADRRLPPAYQSF